MLKKNNGESIQDFAGLKVRAYLADNRQQACIDEKVTLFTQQVTQQMVNKRRRDEAIEDKGPERSHLTLASFFPEQKTIKKVKKPADPMNALENPLEECFKKHEENKMLADFERITDVNEQSNLPDPTPPPMSYVIVRFCP
jgi:hypothetical protein